MPRRPSGAAPAATCASRPVTVPFSTRCPLCRRSAHRHSPPLPAADRLHTLVRVPCAVCAPPAPCQQPTSERSLPRGGARRAGCPAWQPWTWSRRMPLTWRWAGALLGAVGVVSRERDLSHPAPRSPGLYRRLHVAHQDRAAALHRGKVGGAAPGAGGAQDRCRRAEAGARGPCGVPGGLIRECSRLSCYGGAGGARRAACGPRRGASLRCAALRAGTLRSKAAPPHARCRRLLAPEPRRRCARTSILSAMRTSWAASVGGWGLATRSISELGAGAFAGEAA